MAGIRIGTGAGSGATSDSLAMHATAIAIDGLAIVLTGPSGSGKSDLAFRLIEGGAALIADDRLEFLTVKDQLCCRAPPATPPELLGRIELRGIGILPVRTVPGPLPVQWLVDLVPPGAVERLPEPRRRNLLGHDVPVLHLAAFEASAAAKLRLAAARGPGLIMGRE